MKKILGMTLAMLMAVSCFAGCSSAKPNSDKTGSSGSPAGDGTKKDPVTITVWGDPATFDDRYKEKNEEFMKKFSYITVETVAKPYDDGRDLMAAFASGTGPDYTELSYPMAHKYIYANTLTDLSDRIKNWEDYEQINKDMMDMFKVKGQYYVIPKQQYTMALYYNKKILSDAGVTPPTTWDEMLETSKKLTVPSKQQYGFALNYTTWAEWWFEMFVWAAGGDLTKQGDKGELITTFTDPAVIKAGEFYRQMRKAGVIQPDATKQLGDLNIDFGMGRAAMIIGPTDSAGRQVFIDNGMKPENLGMAPMPKGPSGKGQSLVGGTVHGIPKSKDKAKEDAAWEYVKYLCSKECIEADFQWFADTGTESYVAVPRLDVDISAFYEFPEEAKTLLNDTANVKPEFYGKGVVGTFADQAIQEMMADTSKDIAEIFKKYEAEANKKEVPDYNAALAE